MNFSLISKSMTVFSMVLFSSDSGNFVFGSGAVHLSGVELFTGFLFNRALPGIWMKRRHLKHVCLLLLVLLMPVSAFAISLDEAAKQAARQNDAKVLSAKTVQKGDTRIHEIKLLTKKGVVKTVRIPDNDKKR